MKKLVLFTILVTVVPLFGATVAQAGNKVQICHIPPGNPANFHTITISERAFSAHLAHGDLGGACDAACATLCDDGNACTIDDTGDCELLGCPVTPESVNCDDTNECTLDSCDPVDACVNTPLTGAACDDGLVCTGPLDSCDETGECTGDSIPNCCIADSACSDDPCDREFCNDVNRCEADPVDCVPPDSCAVSECASDTGMCVDSDIVCSEEGETCNPNTGRCGVLVAISNDNFCTDELEPGVTTQRLYEFPNPDPTPCDFQLTITNGELSCAPCATADFSTDTVTRIGNGADFCGQVNQIPRRIVLDDLQICARSLVTGDKWDIDFLTHYSNSNACVDNDGGTSCAFAATTNTDGFEVTTYHRTSFVP